MLFFVQVLQECPAVLYLKIEITLICIDVDFKKALIKLGSVVGSAFFEFYIFSTPRHAVGS
jgi:hypothetical protein